MSSSIVKTKILDSAKIKSQFPILEREVHPGVPLVYLDSAATSQKPTSVIEAMDFYYRNSNANIHRGIHVLAEEATASYEGAREKVAKFIGAASEKEIIYTRNTTESINLVAYSWARSNLKGGDTIVLTEMEHHSNIIPWQILAQEIDVQLEFITVSRDGLLDIEQYKTLLHMSPKLVSFTSMSNVLGTITPAKEIVAMAHDVGAATLIDAAQAVPHFPVNVQDLDVDFLAFSSHKMCGPTGIGVLYGKEDILEKMPPFLGGGEMIKRVELRSFSTNDLPHKFEAGTPAIAEAVGLGAAIDYLNNIGMEAVAEHERELTEYALERLEEVPGIELFGPPASKKGGVTAFTFSGVHPHDIAQILDNDGVAIRAGHHCAMPLHKKFDIPATARASFYIYNTTEDIDKLIDGLYKVKEIFG